VKNKEEWHTVPCMNCETVYIGEVKKKRQFI